MESKRELETNCGSPVAAFLLALFLLAVWGVLTSGTGHRHRVWAKGKKIHYCTVCVMVGVSSSYYIMNGRFFPIVVLLTLLCIVNTYSPFGEWSLFGYLYTGLAGFPEMVLYEHLVCTHNTRVVELATVVELRHVQLFLVVATPEKIFYFWKF